MKIFNIIMGAFLAVGSSSISAAPITELGSPEGELNIVSPSIIENSVEHYGMVFDGFEPTSEKRIVEAYRRTISAPISGRVLSQTRAL